MATAGRISGSIGSRRQMREQYRRAALVHTLREGRMPLTSLVRPPMPHKHNDDRRHHIPKMAFKVRNWPEYEAGLRQRGSLTLWIEDTALDHWQTFGPGGQDSDTRMPPSRPP